MARQSKRKTAAELASDHMETIKREAANMVNGWQSRPVSKETWHIAHDRLADLYPLSPAEWERVELLFCEKYEAWADFTQPRKE